MALGSINLTTAVPEPFYVRLNSTTAAVALLLEILFLATVFGRNPALVGSLAAMLCSNYFSYRPCEHGRLLIRKI